MKLVAVDGVLTSQVEEGAGNGHASARSRSVPLRERMFLSEVGSYVRRTVNHRDDPILCELCGSVTEAFQAQQLQVRVFGHVAEVMKWKNDGSGHHFRSGSGSARFCSVHNQRKEDSQYRSAFRVSGEAARWKAALSLAYLHPDSIVQNMVERDLALALSSPRIGQRMIGDRLTLLAEAEKRRPEFIAQAWRTFMGRGENQPAGLATANGIEFTLTHPYDDRGYGSVANGCYRFKAPSRLYERCLQAFPPRSPVSMFLSWASDTAITTKSGMIEGTFTLPDGVREIFDQNPGMGSYADFVEQVTRDHLECRDLVLWVPSVRGWLLFESVKNKHWCEISLESFSPIVRSQTVTLMFEQTRHWKWALDALWRRVKPVFDPSLETYVLPAGIDADM